MRILFFVFVFGANLVMAQSAPQVQLSHTTESLRGVSVVSREVAWASGTHGTYLRTTVGGTIWTPEQVPGAEALDFRAVVAFSADEAFLMSAGPGEQSRIYHTTDTGRHWELQYKNPNPKGFFDAMVFWDRTHGIILGDPVPDESGHLKFELLMTSDGKTWSHIPPAQFPPAIAGEGAFAASNSCMAVIFGPFKEAPAASGKSGAAASKSGASVPWKSGASAPRQGAENDGASAPERTDPNIWFATGGKVARVFHSPDRGKTWQVFDTPMIHGPDSAGIFSIAFRDAKHGVIAGGDYKLPERDGPDLAFSEDGGKTWTLSKIYPQSYYSAVAYDPQHDAAHPRLFIVGPKFIYDFRPPMNPTRLSAGKKSDTQFNAVAPFPEGGALVVGPKGTIALIP